MNRSHIIAIFGIMICVGLSCASPPSTKDKLLEWQRGVWISTGGAYTVWTNTHYFVVQASGDTSNAQIYCGSSRIRFTDKGVARHQNLRIRQTPNTALLINCDYSMFSESNNGGLLEAHLQIDMAMFTPDECKIVEGVIYDSVAEETDEYILLSSCNGDQIKLYNNGRSLYISSNGSEHWSYRIESW
jgi:hypothetical protein